MAKFAPVDCLHMVWSKERVLQERLEEGGRAVRTVDGSSFVRASEDNCIENRAFLAAYMVRQRGARSLDIPDVESLKAQLLSMHTTFVMNCKAKASKRPKALLEATMELVQANAHLDAKALKRLFSYARRRFLAPHAPKDAWMHGPVYAGNERVSLCVHDISLPVAKNPEFADLLELWGDKELYGKSGKKTRWDTKDVDEQAGEEDAFHEYAEDFGEDAEEEDPEDDPPLDVATFPPPPGGSVLDMPLLNSEPAPALHRSVVHMNSSTSIASDATTLVLGETPKTPQPKTLVPAQAVQMTPSPPSLPAVEVRYREVLYVAESPRKMVKAEPRDFEAGCPSGVAKPSLDKEALMSELASLEAAHQALLDAEAKLQAEATATKPSTTEPNATEQNTTKPNATEQSTTEPEPTEPDTEEPEPTEPETTEPEPTEPDVPATLSKESALQELAVLQAELPWSRSLRLTSSGAVEGPAAVFDTDDTQVAPPSVLDLEANRLARLNSTCTMVDSVPAVSREAQLGARKKRKNDLDAKKTAREAQKAAVPDNAKEGTGTKSIGQATVPEKAKEGMGKKSVGQATVPEKARADGKTPGDVVGDGALCAEAGGENHEDENGATDPPAKKRRTAAKSKAKAKAKRAEQQQQQPEAVVQEPAQEPPEAPEPASSEDPVAAPEPGDAGQVSKKGRGKGGRGRGRGTKAGDKKKQGKGARKEGVGEEKIGLRKDLLSTNGTLKHYVLMAYWSRPGVGIKQLSDGRQVQYLGGKGVPMSKIMKAGIDCVSWLRLTGLLFEQGSCKSWCSYPGSCDCR
ncbi:unnamed protein product [Symbiodinium necroappetens]|uniref:Uncharacterized protein n=1 Tax=Symbiodinium necroappetens TaxID=1628268 RepID=A0A812N9Z2_9DINO|nr:unnamed protein product [Symbiodinium necroappetens]